MAVLRYIVLIPFKQGGVFQWIKNPHLNTATCVLIPFKQGGVFQLFDLPNARWLIPAVLIPFKQGGVFQLPNYPANSTQSRS